MSTPLQTEGLSGLTIEQRSEFSKILKSLGLSLDSQILSVAARTSPAGLAMYETREQVRPWRLYPHLELLNSYLCQMARGTLRRLMVFMPPQHGKSQLSSHYFPAWYLGKNPDNRVILGSYEGNFAASWGRRARNTLEAVGQDCFGVTVDQRTSAAAEWMLRDHAGGMVTAGRGQGIAGRPAELLVIDDPLKDAQEANSATIRDQLWDWYRTVAYPRLQRGGAILWIQTRWHEDDGAGRLLAHVRDSGGEPWQVIKLPAIDAAGQALCPELHPLDELLETKRLQGGYYWSALFQQEPQPSTGTIFRREWFRYWHQEGDEVVLLGETGTEGKRFNRQACACFQTVDPAATAKEENDWFVADTWLITPESDLLLLDVDREHAETTKHLGILRQSYAKHQPQVQGVENKTFGLNIIQSALAAGLPVVPLRADTDKVSRSRTVAARYEAGTVYHLRGAPWLDAREQELVEFPRGKHDDQVDTTAYAGILLAEMALAPQRVVYYNPSRISPI